MNESSTDEAEGRRNVVDGGRSADAIRSLVNDRGLQLECARILHESLLVSVLMHGRDNDMEEEGEV